MLNQSKVFRVLILFVWVVQNRAVKNQLGCILSVMPTNQCKKLTFRSQPRIDRLIKPLCLLQRLDSLIMTVFLRKLFVTTHWSITHEPLKRLDRPELSSLKKRRRFLFNDVLMTTRSLCPISSLLASYAESLIISWLGLKFHTRLSNELVEWESDTGSLESISTWNSSRGNISP